MIVLVWVLEEGRREKGEGSRESAGQLGSWGVKLI